MQRTRKPKYPEITSRDRVREPLAEYFITKDQLRERLISAEPHEFDEVSSIVGLLRKTPDKIYEIGKLLGDDDPRVINTMYSIFSTAATHAECRAQVLYFLLQKLKDKNFKFRLNALSAFCHIVRNKVNIMPAIPEITDRLRDSYPEIKRVAAQTLGIMAESRVNISIAVPSLTKALEDDNGGVRELAILALYYAVRAGTDISIAIDNIAKNLEHHDKSVRHQAVSALCEASKRGIDVSKATSNLVKLLSDSEGQLVSASISTLLNVVQTADVNTLEIITKEIVEFVGSDWYHSQGERNTDSYVRAFDAVATIMSVVGLRMNKEEREVA
ncbi:MAG: HEAT repeat domain-containing protein [Candidatus Micrarchaeota archaeon]|nr:HEAT repeat domain-containing protein [Candidatus Micrarchaeota archaeon]